MIPRRAVWAVVYLVAVVMLCLLAALATAVQACEQYEVETLPLTVAVDTTQSYADLTRLAGGKPTFAVTKVRYTGNLLGCTLQVGYANPTIYIATEFAGNACTRNELLAHELRHLQAYATSLSTLANRLRVALLTRPLAQAIEDALADIEPQQHEIDTQDEYRRLMQACGNAIAQRTGLTP